MESKEKEGNVKILKIKTKIKTSKSGKSKLYEKFINKQENAKNIPSLSEKKNKK